MKDVPVEELLEKTGSLFKLVLLAAKRTVELNEGSAARVVIVKNQKPASIALQEIAEGKVEFTLN
ncbi:MAG: DNA-directed RNA polymerase subunit omega [Candidatus Omnitrophota bacterium]